MAEKPTNAQADGSGGAEDGCGLLEVREVAGLTDQLVGRVGE